MLVEQTFEKLNALKLFGMRDALSEQLDHASHASLSFEERVGMLIDREWEDREQRKLERRLKAAKLKMAASMEGIDYRSDRGLDQSLLRSLSDCRWVFSASNVLIIGPTGTGKTYLACALAHQAIRKRGTLPCTSGPPACFRPSSWPRPTAPTPGYSPGWPRQRFWSWTTGGSPPSPMPKERNF